jgi:plasmid stability protein
MISARLDPDLVATLREFAARHGMSLSDVLREAAVQLLAREAATNVITFNVTVTNATRSGTISRESYHQEIPAAI